MKQLHRLIHSLNPYEWKGFLNFLAFFPNKQEPWKKIFALAKIIRGTEDENIAARVYSLRLYGKENEDALIRTGQMLRNKVLEFLSLDMNIADTVSKDDADYALIQLKKKAAQFHLVQYTRQNTAVAQDLLDEIIKQAKEHEAYKILSEHLVRKRQTYNDVLGPEKYRAISSEIEYFEKCYECTTAAFDYLSRLKLFNHFLKNENILLFLESAIKDLEERQPICNSKLLLYVLKQLKQEYYTTLKDYAKAKEICFEIADVVQKSKAVYKKQRMGIAYAQLSVCSVYLKEFTEAIKYAQISLEYFVKGSRNYAFSKEYEYYGLFYNTNYKEAEKCMGYILENSMRKELGEFHHAQYNYLLANALFRQNKHTETFNILKNEWEISKDKSGWELGLRILRIKTNIELQKHDEASKQIEQLRKFIAYNLPRGPEGETGNHLRNKIISKLLSLLEKNSFNFSGLHGKANEHLAALKSKKECAWEYFTPELIPFHEWFEEKVNA